MIYFDYLRITRKKDTKNNFIKFLTSILLYTKERAEKEACLYYGGN